MRRFRDQKMRRFRNKKMRRFRARIRRIFFRFFFLILRGFFARKRRIFFSDPKSEISKFDFFEKDAPFSQTKDAPFSRTFFSKNPPKRHMKIAKMHPKNRRELGASFQRYFRPPKTAHLFFQDLPKTAHLFNTHFCEFGASFFRENGASFRKIAPRKRRMSHAPDSGGRK